LKAADRYIDNLPEPARSIALRIQQMVVTQIPGVEERFSFKIPFYHYYGMLLYINPVKDGGVDIGFCRGKELATAFPQLEIKNRAIVASCRLYTEKDIARYDLAELIVAAAAWNRDRMHIQPSRPARRKPTR